MTTDETTTGIFWDAAARAHNQVGALGCTMLSGQRGGLMQITDLGVPPCTFPGCGLMPTEHISPDDPRSSQAAGLPGHHYTKERR